MEIPLKNLKLLILRLCLETSEILETNGCKSAILEVLERHLRPGSNLCLSHGGGGGVHIFNGLINIIMCFVLFTYPHVV